jgi:ribose transport system permease protein
MIHDKFPWRRIINRQRNVLTTWILLLMIVILGSILSPAFLRPMNLSNLIPQSAALMLVSMGQTCVLLAGGIDISVGSTISLVVTLLAAIVHPDPISIGAGILIALIAGMFVGLINGLLITKLRISPFMATFALMSIGQGIAYLISTTPPTVLPREYSNVFLNNIGFMPIPMLLVIVVVTVFTIGLRYTTFGRHIYAVGSNENATRLSGLPTDKIKILVYIIAGLLAGVAGTFIAARGRSGQPLIGLNFGFDSITVAVLGGVNLAGGRGSVLGTLGGVLIMTIIGNLLNLLGVSSNFQYIFRGLILIIAVAFYSRD